MEMEEVAGGNMNSSPLSIVGMVKMREEAVEVSTSRIVALGETSCGRNKTETETK